METNNEENQNIEETKRSRANRKHKPGKESKPWTEGQRVRAVFIVVGFFFFLWLVELCTSINYGRHIEIRKFKFKTDTGNY